MKMHPISPAEKEENQGGRRPQSSSVSEASICQKKTQKLHRYRRERDNL